MINKNMSSPIITIDNVSFDDHDRLIRFYSVCAKVKTIQGNENDAFSFLDFNNDEYVYFLELLKCRLLISKTKNIRLENNLEFTQILSDIDILENAYSKIMILSALYNYSYHDFTVKNINAAMNEKLDIEKFESDLVNKVLLKKEYFNRCSIIYLIKTLNLKMPYKRKDLVIKKKEIVLIYQNAIAELDDEIKNLRKELVL